MEVARRGPADQLSPRGRGPALFDMKKKRGGGASWGVDAHKVVQLMMGQLHSTADNNNNNNNCTSLAAMNNAADDDKTTLDLLGGESSAHGGAAAASRPISADNGGTSTDFLELLVDDDPEQPRLPSDWKKCLDLKTGIMSFVNKTTGVTWEKYADHRARKLQPLDIMGAVVPQQLAAATEPTPTTTSPVSPRAHEFLRSKKSEILLCEESLRASSSSTSSGGAAGGSCPARSNLAKWRENLQMLSFSTGTQQWNLHLEDTNVSLVKDSDLLLAESDQEAERSNLELDLNLTAGGGGSPAASSCQQQQQREQSVCTMEMVQRALRRTAAADQAGQMDRKSRISGAESPIAGVLSRLSAAAASPSFSSSLSSARSHEPAWSLGSPSTSSSSAGISSARSPRLDRTQTAPALQDEFQQAGSKIASTAGVVVASHEAESKKRPAAATESSLPLLQATSSSSMITALVMGACTRCLMYVMLDKSNPKCPRCGSHALLDFAAPTTPTAAATAGVKRQRVVLDSL
ncbi:unnamed protein product [Sphagnum compactum]